MELLGEGLRTDSRTSGLFAQRKLATGDTDHLTKIIFSQNAEIGGDLTGLSVSQGHHLPITVAAQIESEWLADPRRRLRNLCPIGVFICVANLQFQAKTLN